MDEERRIRARRTPGRVGAALLCPYCRDDVPRRGSVACAARGCGAVYHRECWSELGRGTCAVLGCGSTASYEVTASGHLLRLVRLVVAALLFPPRLIRSIERSRGEGLRAAHRRVVAEAWDFALARNPAPILAERYGRRVLLLVVPSMFLATLALLGGSALVIVGVFKAVRALFGEKVALYCVAGPWIIVYPAATAWVVLHAWAYLLTLAIHAARGLAWILRSEVAALARVDGPPPRRDLK